MGSSAVCNSVPFPSGIAPLLGDLGLTSLLRLRNDLDAAYKINSKKRRSILSAISSNHLPSLKRIPSVKSRWSKLTMQSQKSIPTSLAFLARSPFNPELGIHQDPITLLDILHPVYAPIAKGVKPVVRSGSGGSLSIFSGTRGWVGRGDCVSDEIFSIPGCFEFWVCCKASENLHSS